MKEILIGILALGSFSAFAQSNCNQEVESVAKSVAGISFDKNIVTVSSKMLGYVGFHTKRYNTEVTFEDGDVSKYEVIVHEYETSETNCEIDTITKL
jgi:hypothetical protein